MPVERVGVRGGIAAGRHTGRYAERQLCEGEWGEETSAAAVVAVTVVERTRRRWRARLRCVRVRVRARARSRRSPVRPTTGTRQLQFIHKKNVILRLVTQTLINSVPGKRRIIIIVDTSNDDCQKKKKKTLANAHGVSQTRKTINIFSRSLIDSNNNNSDGRRSRVSRDRSPALTMFEVRRPVCSSACARNDESDDGGGCGGDDGNRT